MLRAGSCSSGRGCELSNARRCDRRCGIAGLLAVKALRRAPIEVVDLTNNHLHQPLLEKTRGRTRVRHWRDGGTRTANVDSVRVEQTRKEIADMATEQQTASRPEQELTAEAKIEKLRQLFADAPEVGKTALENVLQTALNEPQARAFDFTLRVPICTDINAIQSTT
jgi:hypothetical protein